MIFYVNNGCSLKFTQNKPDGAVLVEHLDTNGQPDRRDIIEAGEMVMLYNFFQYVKDQDIKNDFINPNGTVEEKDL